MAATTIQQAFDLALQHHRAGRLEEAQGLYRQILAREPKHADAMHHLGVISHRLGRHDDAVNLIRNAIVLRPNWPQAHRSLGKVLRDKGQLGEAIAAYRQAISLKPDYSQAYGNLGNALREAGQMNEAIAAYRRAVALKPELPGTYSNLGNALQEKGQLDEAIAAYRQAIILLPNYAEAHNNLGHALKAKGQLDEAIAIFQKAIELKPDYAEPHSNLGNALKEKGQLDDALSALRKAIVLNPCIAEFHNNLGDALRAKGQLDEAIAAHHEAIALNPDLPDVYSNLGNAFHDQGQLDEAIAAYRQAVRLDPGNARLCSNLILPMLYHPGFDAKAISEECRSWNREHAQPLAKLIQPHSNDRDADRRLRIGYVSPDFRDHVVGRNVLPLLSQHDHQRFEIVCYSQVGRLDAITQRFQQSADLWRNTSDLTDEQLADQIREDRIDILVDLTLHTANNRLLVFARKPAPVQVTFAGYPGSTGLTEIDYRLSDPYLDPVGMDESVYSEKTIRLPDSFWCYDPLDCRDTPVNPLPASLGGVVTFGCLNNFCKVNNNLLELWAKVLRQVEGSRLLLLAPTGSRRAGTLEFLEQEAIDPARIEFLPRQSRQDYMNAYHRIDLGLDTFPYNGHTTSLDSLWMGVPVATFVGDRVVARAGWCLLSNLGLRELAGETPEQFVRIVVELANDLPRLGQLRSTLRGRMEKSPLMDAPKFARNIETAYRQIWRKWCAGPR